MHFDQGRESHKIQETRTHSAVFPLKLKTLILTSAKSVYDVENDNAFEVSRRDVEFLNQHRKNML